MLDNIPPKLLLLLNIIVIILLLGAIFFFFTEIYYIKEHGGQCVNNPMAWAEQHIREETGNLVDCSCKQIGNYIGELNLTGGQNNGK